jgi:hypothetical protein
MDASWTNVFYDKLIVSKLISCSLVFVQLALRKKHSRKRNTGLFRCHARCQDLACPINVRIVMAQRISVGYNVIFRLQINGTHQHNNSSIKTARPLTGVMRLQMGN